MGGGMGHLLGLFAHLDRDKYHLSLVADRGDYLVDQIRALDIPIHFVPMMKRRYDLRVAAAIAKVAGVEQADVLHCHGTRAAFYGALAKPFSCAKKSIYTVHGFSFSKDVHSVGRAFYLNVEKLLARAHDRLISVSQMDTLGAIEKGVCTAEKIRTIPNAIDFARFDPACVNGHFRQGLGISKSVKLVGTAARLVRQKGIDSFIDAAKIVCNDKPDVRFVVIGEGELEGRLRDKARKKKMNDHLIFAGARDSMPEVYAGLDVFVLPSLWEGHPLTLIEALAMGTPSVATWTSGSPEIIEDGKSGLLVPPKDSRALARAICRLLDDTKFACRLAKVGQRSVRKRYSLQKMASLNEEVLQSLLQSPNLV
jgi:glycosyltransferase involved in cell wall biosynthesis